MAGAQLLSALILPDPSFLLVDSMLHLLPVLASGSILGAVCVHAGSVLYPASQRQCPDGLTLQELSQIQLRCEAGAISLCRT